jgi:hypothetical protein
MVLRLTIFDHWAYETKNVLSDLTIFLYYNIAKTILSSFLICLEDELIVVVIESDYVLEVRVEIAIINLSWTFTHHLIDF